MEKMRTKVGKKFIIEHYEAYGGLKPPPITHDAIDDRRLEKASGTKMGDVGENATLGGGCVRCGTIERKKEDQAFSIRYSLFFAGADLSLRKLSAIKKIRMGVGNIISSKGEIKFSTHPPSRNASGYWSVGSICGGDMWRL